jgi:endonuclease YncB( thermonuclease family)
MANAKDDGKLVPVLIILVTIVVSIIIVNGIFFQDEDGGDGDVYIPDYPAGEYVSYVSDGDTFRTVDGEYVRLLGINTEETGQPHSAEAKSRLEQLLSGGKIKMERDEEDVDRYGRLLRYVWAGETFVNIELAREGHAHVYIIEPNVKHSSELRAAEREAIEARRGLWEESPFAVDIASLNPVQGSGTAGLSIEAVVLRNNGTVSIDMTNWTCKDESTHIYNFQGASLQPGGSLSLRSGYGTNTATEVYWNIETSIWNNDGDICFVRDENGLLVDAVRYTSDGSGYVWEHY